MGQNLSEIQQSRELWREHRRRRFRRRSRRTYIRSVYSLPSLATLGNAICGFGAMYVCTLSPGHQPTTDVITLFFSKYSFVAGAYLVFLAMVFDALDGRLARFARHTTDFGGQLDSLADVVSFGCAPAFMAILLFKESNPDVPVVLSRLVWAIGALYMCCAAIRLARFNVSNEHGEHHHFSFLGLPSPGAAGTVVAVVLLQQDIAHRGWSQTAGIVAWSLPAIVLLTGLLMVSNIRYPHLVNRYLRGKKSLPTLVLALAGILGIYVAHRYVLAIGTLGYALSGLLSWAFRGRHQARPAEPAPEPAPAEPPPSEPPHS